MENIPIKSVLPAEGHWRGVWDCGCFVDDCKCFSITCPRCQRIVRTVDVVTIEEDVTERLKRYYRHCKNETDCTERRLARTYGDLPPPKIAMH